MKAKFWLIAVVLFASLMVFSRGYFRDFGQSTSITVEIFCAFLFMLGPAILSIGASALICHFWIKK